jgi:MFS family permease
MLYIGGNAMVLDISTDENRGRFSGRYQMWFLLGVAVASFVGGLLTDLLGFRGAMWLTTGVIGTAAIMWLFFLPETRRNVPHPAQNLPVEENLGVPWGIVFGAGLPVFVSRFIGWGVLAATMILWLETFVKDGITWGGLEVPLATLTGAVTALTMLFSMGAAPAAGWLSDKVGQRWGVLAGSLLVGAIGLGLMSGPVIGWALVGVFMAQITGASVEVLVPAITGDRVRKRAQGRTLGLIYTLGDLGSTLGPAIALGLLEMGSVSLAQIYLSCALLLILVTGFAWVQTNK